VPPAVIRQVELFNLHRARQEARAATQRCHNLRDDILARYDEGAGVQAGTLELTVNPTSAHRLTKADVAAVIGEAKLAWLLERIPVSWSRTVTIKGIK
jgi:hypothetical protein